MMHVVAGDWRDGPIVYKKSYGGMGSPIAFVMPKGWFGETVPISDMIKIEPITEENRTSVLGKVAWGAAGSLLLGPVGLLAGVLGGGNSKQQLALLTFRDNRSAMVKLTGKDMEFLTIQLHKTLLATKGKVTQTENTV